MSKKLVWSPVRNREPVGRRRPIPDRDGTISTSGGRFHGRNASPLVEKKKKKNEIATYPSPESCIYASTVLAFDKNVKIQFFFFFLPRPQPRDVFDFRTARYPKDPAFGTSVRSPG